MSTTAARPKAKRTPVPFDPHAATYEGEEWQTSDHARLAFRCPSRRSTSSGYLLTCEEDGSRPWCSCDGHTYHARCTHSDQAAEIVRLTFANVYTSLPEAELVALDRALTARFVVGPVVSAIRYDVLGEELAKRARMKDRPLLNLRGQRAKSELFGEVAG